MAARCASCPLAMCILQLRAGVGERIELALHFLHRRGLPDLAALHWSIAEVAGLGGWPSTHPSVFMSSWPTTKLAEQLPLTRHCFHTVHRHTRPLPC